MEEYGIQRLDLPDIGLDGDPWERAPELSVARYPWRRPGSPEPPRTGVRLLYNGQGIFLRFEVVESDIRATYTRPNDPVNRDSCVEFFMTPNLTDVAYLSFETNPLGTMLIGYGTGPRGILYLDEDRRTFRIESELRSGSWRVKYMIPFAFLARRFGSVDRRFKGNFMKCADASAMPHHGCWNEIRTDVPMFHVPEFFGRLELRGGGDDESTH